MSTLKRFVGNYIDALLDHKYALVANRNEYPQDTFYYATHDLGVACLTLWIAFVESFIGGGEGK